MPTEFEARLVAFSKRAMRIASHCASDEAAKIYLVMPFLELLGYDAGDPSTIVPDHEGAIDFTIMVAGVPGIAIATTGAAWPAARVEARLRTFWPRHKTLEVGLTTNGVVYQFFIDSDLPGTLDAEPCLTVDLADISANGADAQQIALLRLVRSVELDHSALVDLVVTSRVKERMKYWVLEQFRAPSDALCRLMLDQIGIRGVRSDALEQHYRPLLKSSIEQAIIVPVVQVLRSLPPPVGSVASEPPPGPVVECRPKLGLTNVEMLSEGLADFSRNLRRRA
jgi:predicted type IV restriction endonuclease